jgi:Uncharacterized protein conserved in bacteria (DUF2125)
MFANWQKTFVVGALSLGIATPVFAQSLAETVIEEYFSEIEKGGLSIVFSDKSTSGSVSEWTNIVMSDPSDDVKLTIPWLKAEDIGGGTVSLSYAPEITVAINADGEDVSIAMRSENVDYKISGTANARAHDYSASSMTIETVKAPKEFNFSVALSDVANSQVNSVLDYRNFKGALTAKSAKISYSVDDGDVQMSSDGTFSDFKIGYDVDAVSEEDAPKLLSGERGITLDYSIGSGSSTTNISQPSFVGNIKASQGASEGKFSVADGMFTLVGSGSDIKYEVDLSAMGLFPFAADMNKIVISVGVPLTKTDAAQEANLLLTLADLSVSDSIWGMIDPAVSLPRDPATLNIDVTAMIRWVVEPIMMEQSKEVPVQVDNIKINDLTLQLAGVNLTGNGDIDVKNDGPIPEPIGQINLDLKGGFGLLDKLSALGLVQPDQAMMVRAMSGMFTVPGGEGNDHLVSKIEMQAGGAILANGQRIK